jgi:deoxyribodipyrimidine photo-lyase
MPDPTAIVWFRRDLRLADNPALAAAVNSGARIVAVYLHAPGEEGTWAPGAASRWWLHHSLAALDAALRTRGSSLTLRTGPSLQALLDIARETGATAVHWNRVYEPALVERDTRIKAELRRQGLQCQSHNASLLVEPWDLRTGQGGPYRVFTPFWRAAQARLVELPPLLRSPARLTPPDRAARGVPLDTLGLLPRFAWDQGLAAAWTPGEDGATERLETFCREALADYDTGRNRPDLAGSSRLSPHLHFGEVGPRQCFAAAQALPGNPTPEAAHSAGSFVRELGWREFAYHLLHHFPHTTERPLDERFERFEWASEPEWLEAWQRGRTGYPIVDAGMRELWATGWMHNRVRMLVASLLAKNLRQPWRAGARWFWDTLVDADLASNTLGWQWTAGCGADAAPYFRIFNPVLQAERHDPGRAYLRRWLPELARLPDAWIHRPWQAPAEVLAEAGVQLGRQYPLPVVDFPASRQAALDGYAALRSASIQNGGASRND